ncbi:SDR family NAD(P)-dependent oxidoreductase [Martelella radicis]|uniref:NAD(P)-dependent dehydrogenase (Short-subunit alcohol dehydrogenase family) n=1 Tax=Martelella radicis TaxID=1397476 RepID=A0A7W6KKR9_9HYPH|nr:SDR family NAD(P)-dependent oxidoreductase [Martelella radicis]MBB4123111.1 NAD(P)-dependent dehydrogenase (short-subunit alcohol dehydrogenase family) [Martelella radicis]
MSKVWLITGSARGLGLHIAKAVLEAGDRLVATARNPGQLAPLAAEFGDQVAPFALDVTDPAAAQAAVDFAVDTFGRLDVLINNAGFGHFAPFEQTDPDHFRAQIETNFFGVVNMTRAALPVMRTQRSGNIINISSVGGRMTGPGMSAYQSAKWAVSGFSEIIARETSHLGIRTVSIEPGGMRTEWGQIARGDAPRLWKDYEPAMGAMQAVLEKVIGNEIGSPDRIAGVILDLAERDDVPEHLLLGSDAVELLKKAEDKRRREAEAWEGVSRSTDFEDADLSFLKHI